LRRKDDDGSGVVGIGIKTILKMHYMEMMSTTVKGDKKYPVIYVDVPWEDKDCPIERVRGLPVEKWSAQDALMLMWVPVMALPDVLLIMRTWGFDYAGLLVWRRPKDYLEGYWWRSHCEYLLVGKRGAIKADSLIKNTLYEGSYCNKDFRPQGFRALLANAGLFVFSELTARLDIFGGYWLSRFPEYEKENWDFLEG